MAITTNNLISRQTVGSDGAASITFSNIPQTFTDLLIKISTRCSTTTTAGTVSFNGSTSNFTGKRLYGDGTSAATDSSTSAVLTNDSSFTASTFANSEIYIPNYASANYKSVSIDGVSENNATTAYAMLNAILWSNTAAITSVTITPAGGNFVEFSTFSLYGISSSTSTQNTSIPLATGGDVITTDGTYWYHAFKYSGTFTPLKALTAECLVVAGGGGSPTSGNVGGGAGAGGILYHSGKSVTTDNYAIVIGSGGAAGSNGSDSTMSTMTAVGGGKGGTETSPAAGSGGSGGGGSYNSAAGSSTQSSSGGATGYGFAGGTGAVVTLYEAGGGGGAGAVGTTTDGSPGNPPNGGAGLNTWSAWASATSTGASGYYGGGGGGGAWQGASSASTGGAGGGGAGGAYSYETGTNGTVNTGGGAGGFGQPSGNTHSGGSGIVIVRYAV